MRKKTSSGSLLKRLSFLIEEVVINFFEVPEEEFQLESIQKVGFDQLFNWLRKSNSMRNFGHRFDIRTFQAERGKYRIEITN